MNSDANVALSIGAWIGDGAGFSTSMIDDLKVFDTVLSQEEVQALLAPPTDILLDPNEISTAASQGDPSTSALSAARSLQVQVILPRWSGDHPSSVCDRFDRDRICILWRKSPSAQQAKDAVEATQPRGNCVYSPRGAQPAWSDTVQIDRRHH